MQAIQTRYIGPTNFRGSRISAWCAAKRISVTCDDRYSVARNHRLAALELCRRLNWDHGRLAMGQLKSGDYVHVFADMEWMED